MSQKITPFLWFGGRLGEAIELYTSTFPDSEVLETVDRDGQLFTANFRIGGIEVSGMNVPEGPVFNEAISLVVDCDDQAEVDRYWEALTAGGGREDRCGWLVDPFGVSWQITPRRLIELVNDPDPARAQRAMEEMLTQNKIDIAAIERAADG
ncbi:VOC family protein [Protaetiibacter sp. SSC-01]|uniref:VOC family protein n=1 Tax=Protaetiibacter sp. SSC-01 TaxID=2759943 RepID=UPI001656C2CA|nr:VOC family protein [Protaetiibacter sp. SSC-01]QNO38045.1 VOC family protein [Protaetiibacter sp. SSC-01]